MRELNAAAAALFVTALVLLLSGFVVCPLAIVTQSIPVALIGFGVAIPFSFYAGYRAAAAVLRRW